MDSSSLTRAMILMELHDQYGQKAVDYVKKYDISNENILKMMKRGIIR